MKAMDIREHFLSKASWVDMNTTVDRIILGDPEKEIRRILVTWMSTLTAVRYAIKNGFDMLMTHEPTFWLPANEIGMMNNGGIHTARMAAACEKRKLIEESGLVVLRNHDVWDRMPDIGIPWALARFLGLHGKPFIVGREGYQLGFDIEEASACELAERIAGLTADFGDPVVQLFGCGAQNITKLGIGTGCFCMPDIFLEMGCDGAVVCDDGCTYWRDISWALEAGLPIIRIGHATSEEPGMATLTEYINSHIPEVTATHFGLLLGVTYMGERSG